MCANRGLTTSNSCPNFRPGKPDVLNEVPEMHIAQELEGSHSSQSLSFQEGELDGFRVCSPKDLPDNTQRSIHPLLLALFRRHPFNSMALGEVLKVIAGLMVLQSTASELR